MGHGCGPCRTRSRRGALRVCLRARSRPPESARCSTVFRPDPRRRRAGMRLRPLPLPAGRRRDPDPSANRNHNPLDLRAEYLLRLTRRPRREGDPTTGNPRSDGVRIDAALVRRLIAAQFPRWADLPVRPVEAGGWDNRTFRIGSPMTARLSSAEQYALQVEKGRRWLPKLAPLLPLPIPVPLAKGASAEVYPWQWSVYRRIEGEAASVGRIADLRQFATDLAEFLNALRRIDPTGAPPPGRHNLSRGGRLRSTTPRPGKRPSTSKAGSRPMPRARCGRRRSGQSGTVWPVWFHGDVASGNLRVAGWPVERRHRLRRDVGHRESHVQSGDRVDPSSWWGRAGTRSGQP